MCRTYCNGFKQEPATQFRMQLNASWLSTTMNPMLKALDEIKRILLRRVTSGPAPGDDANFKNLRSILLSHDAVSASLPPFIRDAWELEDAWTAVDQEVTRGAGAWGRRRAFISDGMRASFRVAEALPRGASDDDIVTALEVLDSEAVQRGWQRAIQRRSKDSAAAITSARSLLESVCKHILDELGVAYSKDDSVGNLYVSCAKELAVHPSTTNEAALKQFFQSCVSTSHSLGVLRNTYGDAHGTAKTAPTPSGPQAALAVDLAGALSVFLTRTFEDHRPVSGNDADTGKEASVVRSG